MPLREAPSWETVRKRNLVERLKHERFPTELWDDWRRVSDTPYEALPEEDIVRLQWFGLYHDRPKVGSFMMRVKIPGGILKPSQLGLLGELAEQYGHDQAELTTRQNVQLHYVTLGRFPEIFARLQGIGLTTMGGCGDVVRNITGCPVAGLAKDELFDAREVVAQAAAFFYGNREYSDLPRKHKITVATCPAQCNAPEINCIALIGVLQAGRKGFAVSVGGGLSSTPRLARSLGVFVPAARAVEILRAILDVWRLTTEYRISRVKARLKFMVDDYGPHRFRELVEERLGGKLEDLAEAPVSQGEADHLGVREQRQPGLFYAGFPVPLGLVKGGQMRKLAAVAESLGGDVRLTRQQNFILAGIPENRLQETLSQVAEIGFPLDAYSLYGSSIACTGEPHCNYAVTPTKPKLASIIDHLRQRFGTQADGLRINLDGCPHACAHHWTGDIGLQGTTGRGANGEPLEAFDVILGGGMGVHAAIGRPVVRRVPSRLVEECVARLVEGYLAQRLPGERFASFCTRTPADELVAIARGVAPGEASAAAAGAG